MRQILLIAIFFIIGMSDGNAARENKKSDDRQKFTISVDSEEGIIKVDGKIINKEMAPTFKRFFKDAIKRHEYKDQTRIGSDIYVGPSDRVNDVVVIGGDATIEGEVNGDVVVIGGSLTIGEGADIFGDVVTIAGMINRQEKSIIHGSIVRILSSKAFLFVIPPLASFIAMLGTSMILFVVYFLWIFILILGVGFLAQHFMPNRSLGVKEAVSCHPLLSIGIGLLVFFSFIPLSGILILSIIGISLIPLLIIILPILTAWGVAMVLTFIGERIPIRREQNRYVDFLIGVMMIFGVSLIPWIGKVVLFFIGMLGLGAVFISKFGYREKKSQCGGGE